MHLKKWSYEQVQFLFELAYWCGLRMDEAVKPKVEDFDFDTHELYLGKTKTEKGATALIPPEFESIAKLYLEGKKGSLFPGLTYNRVWHWLKELGEKLDIKALTTPVSESGENTVCHIFRKSFAKDMLYGTYGRKAPLNYIMKHLRHTNLDTTTKYLRIQKEDLKDWFRNPNEESDHIMLS